MLKMFQLCFCENTVINCVSVTSTHTPQSYKAIKPRSPEAPKEIYLISSVQETVFVFHLFVCSVKTQIDALLEIQHGHHKLRYFFLSLLALFHGHKFKWGYHETHIFIEDTCVQMTLINM